MKISKSLLQTIAVAVVAGSITTSCVKDLVKVEPKKEKKETYNCPGCGMG